MEAISAINSAQRKLFFIIVKNIDRLRRWCLYCYSLMKSKTMREPREDRSSSIYVSLDYRGHNQHSVLFVVKMSTNRTHS
mmetsp:Transcript_22425/g.47376  ORF Transcript_22425/g.47376 Transcript_22425/m.47376 type:complete len:80 (-) Transcript_22425:76-315(-)